MREAKQFKSMFRLWLFKFTLLLLFVNSVNSSTSESDLLLESSREELLEERQFITTSIISVTTQSTSTAVCVKLVNVTGACLRRRGAWVEEPIVLTFDDELEDQVDILYSPVIGIEETKLPEGFDAHSLHGRSTKEPDLSSSVADFGPKQAPSNMFTRFFGWLTSGLTGLFGAGNPQGGGGSPGNVQSPQTVTQIQIQTQTSTVTEKLSLFHTVFMQTKTVMQLHSTTHYNTIFIQRCTPSPFPFTLCSGK